MSAQEFKNQVARVSHSSNTFHKLGTFMEENWVSVGMLSATEVAKRAGVSQGSVTRFCNELGFAGYSEFSKKWKQSIYEPLSAPDRLKNIRGEHADLARMIEVEQENLNRLPEIVSGEAYRKIVKAMTDRKKSFCCRQEFPPLSWTRYIICFPKSGTTCRLYCREAPNGTT